VGKTGVTDQQWIDRCLLAMTLALLDDGLCQR